MPKINWKHIVIIAVIAVAILFAATALVPCLAWGEDGGWKGTELISSGIHNTAIESDANEFMSTSKILKYIKAFLGWALGVAIVLFVLRVVLTAINRMVFKDPGTDGKVSTRNTNESALERIPFIGAWPDSTPWREIFIHFGKQVAIAAGVWVICDLIINIALFVLNSGVNDAGVTK